MKVLSIPHLNQLSDSESGIHTVIRNYFRLAGEYGIEFVTEHETADLIAIHAGMGKAKQNVPVVVHLHGLYWTGDYYMPQWAFRSNEHIVDALRHSSQVTVPSPWVAETLQRDMHLDPHVLPHGINWDEWQHQKERGNYVVGYAKNRAGMDVCNPDFLADLCPRFPKTKFYATFSPLSLQNVEVTGVIPHRMMRSLVQGARVFISTTKETFGIAILEAQAAGVPVLAYRQGGAISLVRHGITGYLAEPDNIDDLSQGLAYCMQHAAILGANAREHAKQFTWDKALEKLAAVYESAVSRRSNTVSVIIPAYNKERYLQRAVESALAQTHRVAHVVIVDNNSTDNTAHIGRSLAELHQQVSFFNEPQQGVAHARNAGIERVPGSKYICCLDADDWLDERFIEVCFQALEADRSLGIAYTGLTWHAEDGKSGNSKWPEDFRYDNQLKRKNQVPTACLFRRDLWERLGGYRQRYAPHGAGSEDADFWTRIGAIGYAGRKATDAGLFHYQAGGQVSSDPHYREADWLAWHPWAHDGQHPFASVATPLRASHPVRQYDEPVVSVIIPVGVGHLEYLTDALDSLEAQTFRRWEAIVVLDNWGDDSTDDSPTGYYVGKIKSAHPFARIYTTYAKGRSMGAGYARNRGAEVARGSFLLFLDADDWLQPTCLEEMLDGWGRNEAAIYSDYIGIAQVDDLTKLDHRLQQDVLDYDAKRRRAVIRHRLVNFDETRARRQPEDLENMENNFIWCNITTLLPKTWHFEIGGFDERMTSWEDWDYWLRLARAGKCFCRIAEPLLVYRFHTGTRRDTGRQRWVELLHYLGGKLRNV